MQAKEKIKEPPIIPPKQHVYLDGPKSRGYELWFAWRVFWQFIKGFRKLHFMGPSSRFLVRRGLKKKMNIIKTPCSLENVLQKWD
jgi:hypothetical protein